MGKCSGSLQEKRIPASLTHPPEAGRKLSPPFFPGGCAFYASPGTTGSASLAGSRAGFCPGKGGPCQTCGLCSLLSGRGLANGQGRQEEFRSFSTPHQPIPSKPHGSATRAEDGGNLLAVGGD